MQCFYLLQKMLNNINLVFVIIVENMSEETCTLQVDNSIILTDL